MPEEPNQEHPPESFDGQPLSDEAIDTLLHAVLYNLGINSDKGDVDSLEPLDESEVMAAIEYPKHGPALFDALVEVGVVFDDVDANAGIESDYVLLRDRADSIHANDLGDEGDNAIRVLDALSWAHTDPSRVQYFVTEVFDCYGFEGEGLERSYDIIGAGVAALPDADMLKGVEIGTDEFRERVDMIVQLYAVEIKNDADQLVREDIIRSTIEQEIFAKHSIFAPDLVKSIGEYSKILRETETVADAEQRAIDVAARLAAEHGGQIPAEDILLWMTMLIHVDSHAPEDRL